MLKVGGHEAKSKTIKKTLNPVWNETFDFEGPLHIFLDTGLEINVFDKDWVRTASPALCAARTPPRERETVAEAARCGGAAGR